MRDEGRASAGYFPLPPRLTAAVAGLVTFQQGWSIPHPRGWKLLDPCAGGGEAAAGLRDWWMTKGGAASYMGVVAIELEKSRWATARKNLPKDGDVVLHGDAFSAAWLQSDDGASILYLNPPYDTDADHGRAEQKFLHRFTPALAPGGALLFVVPLSALGASAPWLGQHYTHLSGYRFPDPEYAVYKQVVIVGKRCAVPISEGKAEEAAETIRSWALYPARLPVLGAGAPKPVTVSRGTYGLALRLLAFDRFAAETAFRAWRGAPVGAELDVDDVMGRKYPVALPPKPAHLAMALCAGHFNGHRLEPNDPRDPEILVKGVNLRPLVTVKEDEAPDGGSRVTKVQTSSFAMSVLTLDTFSFLTPGPGAEPTNDPNLANCNAMDILQRYSGAFSALLETQFPPLHNPAEPKNALYLPPLPRPPFRAQREAISAMLKLLGAGESTALAAEVGVGKTSMALYAAAACSPRYRPRTVEALRAQGLRSDRLPRAHRTLIVCPPHLVSTWLEEIHGNCTCPVPGELVYGRCTRCHGAPGCMPWARVQVCKVPEDLRNEADFYVMSRETAKLGHAYRGISGSCPRCSAPIRATPEECADKRLTCQAKTSRPANAWARLAEELAAIILPLCPDDQTVASLVARRRTLARRTGGAAIGMEEPPRATMPNPLFGRPRLAIRDVFGVGRPRKESVLSLAIEILGTSGLKPIDYRVPVAIVSNLAMATGSQAEVAELLMAVPGSPRSDGKIIARQTADGLLYPAYKQAHLLGERNEFLRLALEQIGARAEWDGRPAYKLSRARQRIRSHVVEGEPAPAEVCGEPLYQADEKGVRRYPLARYVVRHMRDRFGLVIIDEAHEASNRGSAQEQALHRLAGIAPTIELSGSFMGGYSSSLFASTWARDRKLRMHYEYGDGGRFVNAFGLQKFVFTEKANGKGNRGKTTDKKDLTMRAAGEAPGILPIFLLRHFLRTAVLVHKDDLDQELPPLEETTPVLAIETAEDRALLAEYGRLEEELLSQIKEDMFTNLSGQLWGALMELPSYLDRCTEDLPPFELRYPANPDLGDGRLVAAGQMFPAKYRTPKERALLAFVEAELAEGRKVMVALRNVESGLPERLTRILKASKVATRVAYLSSKKVKAADRNAWIKEEVAARDVEVLLVNAESVKTGLNSLTYFASGWVHQMSFDARTYRQWVGRLHRIGQVLPVRIRVPHYKGTAQEVALDLIARKVGASLAVDALGVRGALEQAFGGEDKSLALSMGEALYKKLREARG